MNTYANPTNDPKVYDIALCSFAFKNSELIHKLQERGRYIMKKDVVSLRKVNKQIQKMKEDPKYQKKFIRPCEVFITFQYTEGSKRFQEFIRRYGKTKLEVDGEMKHVC